MSGIEEALSRLSSVVREGAERFGRSAFGSSSTGSSSASSSSAGSSTSSSSASSGSESETKNVTVDERDQYIETIQKALQTARGCLPHLSPVEEAQGGLYSQIENIEETLREYKARDEFNKTLWKELVRRAEDEQERVCRPSEEGGGSGGTGEPGGGRGFGSDTPPPGVGSRAFGSRRGSSSGSGFGGGRGFDPGTPPGIGSSAFGSRRGSSSGSDFGGGFGSSGARGVSGFRPSGTGSGGGRGSSMSSDVGARPSMPSMSANPSIRRSDSRGAASANTGNEIEALKQKAIEAIENARSGMDFFTTAKVPFLKYLKKIYSANKRCMVDINSYISSVATNFDVYRNNLLQTLKNDDLNTLGQLIFPVEAAMNACLKTARGETGRGRPEQQGQPGQPGGGAGAAARPAQMKENEFSTCSLKRRLGQMPPDAKDLYVNELAWCEDAVINDHSEHKKEWLKRTFTGMTKGTTRSGRSGKAPCCYQTCPKERLPRAGNSCDHVKLNGGNWEFGVRKLDVLDPRTGGRVNTGYTVVEPCCFEIGSKDHIKMENFGDHDFKIGNSRNPRKVPPGSLWRYAGGAGNRLGTPGGKDFDHKIRAYPRQGASSGAAAQHVASGTESDESLAAYARDVLLAEARKQPGAVTMDKQAFLRRVLNEKFSKDEVARLQRMPNVLRDAL